MILDTEPYLEQQARWPRSGRHILAQHDAGSVVVYQAFCPGIGHFAARHGRLGGGFSLGRMSWIKPNFLWMMYRCGWATKPDQEVVLAIRLSRSGFDEVLRLAVHSSSCPEVYGTEAAWKEAVARSDVRLQWDPDHGPSGQPLQRRAIQLGLRGEALSRYVEEWAMEIEDITGFVREQRAHAASPFERLVTPREGVYPVEDAEVARKLGLSEWGGEPLAPS
ncbi:DUF4291 domain-containing protein [Tautonia plasticadhaerens]|uniref:DUF4291 domain-containing protein n=1 Tax=Tautonia plasticadhaerens TaxID=2527974 RepID=A0A518H4F7_9BACT|nr:DUF4291 domain-containing protein [Tautonia plasticadhaerens]QDV35716.1 hypothetical protein ElP_36210 [Tautonia plasticadhaerens]